MSEKQSALDRLFAVIESRRGTDPAKSYSAKLLAAGRPAIVKKLGEEASETAVAALSEGKDRLVSESADLLYHLVLLWAEAGIKPDEIWTELERREKQSGIAEKESRPKK